MRITRRDAVQRVLVALGLGALVPKFVQAFPAKNVCGMCRWLYPDGACQCLPCPACEEKLNGPTSGYYACIHCGWQGTVVNAAHFDPFPMADPAELTFAGVNHREQPIKFQLLRRAYDPRIDGRGGRSYEFIGAPTLRAGETMHFRLPIDDD